MDAVVSALRAAGFSTCDTACVDQPRAAVLVPLFTHDTDGVCVLLTRRASHLRTHAGEVALPGGRCDEGESVVDTALREAEEEVGLRRSDVLDVVCCMDTRVSKFGLLVTPVVAVIRPDFKPVAAVDEVASVFVCPLRRFLSAEGHFAQDILFAGTGMRLHFFSVPRPAVLASFDAAAVPTPLWPKHGVAATTCVAAATAASGDNDASPGVTVFGLTAAVCLRVAAVAFGAAPDFDADVPGYSYWPEALRPLTPPSRL